MTIQKPWTLFHDMHSGGGQKLAWHHIYIEAPLTEAKAVFKHKLGRCPDNVTCDCCGEDYSINEEVSLAQASGYERRCRTLKTPSVNGRYVQPEDPEFLAHYWLEDGELPPAGYEANDRVGWSHEQYRTLEQYLTDPGVKVVYAAEISGAERVPPEDD